MKVLVISNMGAKKSAPTLGLFVDKQFAQIKQVLADVSYFNLTFNGDSLFHKLFKYPFFFLRFFIYYIFSRQRIDIIHVHYYFPTIICAAFYKFFRNGKVRIIVTCHGGDIYCYQPPSWLYRKLSFIVDYWFFTSKKLAARFYRNIEHYEVLCAGFDDSVFIASKKLETLTEKNIDCLLVGNLDFNKGLDRLIFLVKHMPEVHFAVVGAGSFKSQLLACAQQYNNLTVFGSKSPTELADIIKQSKFLLSLSRNESFGLVLSEAHACGTPCIVTATDGSLEQLPQWQYTVKQTNGGGNSIVENSILEQFQRHITQALAINLSEYRKLQQQRIEDSKQYALSNVITKIVLRYQKLNFKAQGKL